MTPSALVASGMRIVFQCVVLRLRGDGLNGNGDGVRLGDGSPGAVVLGAEVQLQNLDHGTVKTGKDGRGVSRAPLPPHSLKSTGDSPQALFKRHELPANRRCFRLPHATPKAA